MSKRVIINADDLGLHACVDNAILDLSQKNVISSASLMSYGNPSAEVIRQIMKENIAIGLHFDLTSSLMKQERIQRQAHYQNIKQVIQKSWLRQLPASLMIEEFRHQLERFVDIVGDLPVFIDGHEHVHQYPVIRESIWQVLVEKNIDKKIYLRSTRPTTLSLGRKALLIYMLGGWYTTRYCNENNLLTNNGFAGSYDFNPNTSLLYLWKKWLKSMPENGGLIMCHPAQEDSNWSDNIAQARMQEYKFLSSETFQDLLQQQKAIVSTWQ